MNVINPFAGAIAQTPALQKLQASEKAAQIRHQQELKRNIAPQGDQFEHIVESAEELRPAREHRDEDPRKRQQRQQQQQAKDEEPPTDEPPRIDVTA